MVDHQQPGTAREQLLDAAERLISEHGTALPMRRVVVEAGQRNNAAVRYHFGTRDELIAAIIERRQTSLERDRLALLAAREAEGRLDLRGLVEVLLEPVFKLQREPGAGHHARFMEKVRDYPGLVLYDRSDWPATSLIVTRIQQLLDNEPSRARARRMRLVNAAVFSLLADLERTADEHVTDRERTQNMVIDMVVALMSTQSTDRSVGPTQ